jgi:hypothetical protein
MVSSMGRTAETSQGRRTIADDGPLGRQDGSVDPAGAPASPRTSLATITDLDSGDLGVAITETVPHPVRRADGGAPTNSGTDIGPDSADGPGSGRGSRRPRPEFNKLLKHDIRSRIMRFAFASLALALVLAMTGSARAQVTFNWLENGTGNQMTPGPENFTEPGFAITATAYTGVTGAGSSMLSSLGSASPADHSNDLFAKNDGGDEVGLGLTSDPSGDHEITVGKGILIDFSKVSTAQPYTITFGSNTTSTTGGTESVGVYDATTLKLVGQIVTGNSPSIVIGPGATDLKYLVTETSSATGTPNGLLGAVTITPVPEPSTMAIAGLGAIGFVAYGLRRRMARTA